ncbi:MAG: hypothetical protein HQ507_07215 [Candidatus Marinimicrobia bacterium]|nr:hypothetical protein [Candidatus Neomarinimicrobiota bacterium]
MRLMKRLFFAALLVWSVSFWSCDVINSADDNALVDFTCEGCHTNRASLENIIDALNLDPPASVAEAPG